MFKFKILSLQDISNKNYQIKLVIWSDRNKQSKTKNKLMPQKIQSKKKSKVLHKSIKFTKKAQDTCHQHLAASRNYSLRTSKNQAIFINLIKL